MEIPVYLDAIVHVGQALPPASFSIASGQRLTRAWLHPPYFYGIIICMKKTLNIDDDLFTQAKVACGASTDTETVRLGLQALVRHAAYQNLRALMGSEPHAQDVPRRRERARTKHGAA
jgi:Arc/MetJ family transcription regulator